MNPSATQQHHARSMMHLMQARASPTTYTAPPTTSTSYYLSSSGGGRRQHFSFKSRYDVGRFPNGAPPHLIAGGTLVVLRRLTATPTTGKIRSVHRPYLCHPLRGEITQVTKKRSGQTFARKRFAKRYKNVYITLLSNLLYQKIVKLENKVFRYIH